MPCIPCQSKWKPASKPPLKWHFTHGLGDCANFAHIAAMYVSRGYAVDIACAPDKAFVFADTGATVTQELSGHELIPYGEPQMPTVGIAEFPWLYNKAGVACVMRAPRVEYALPDCWNSLCGVEMDLRLHVPAETTNAVETLLRYLPRPLVLFHTQGNTFREGKNVAPHNAERIYGAIMDAMGGTLLLMDWDNRITPGPKHRHRWRNVQDEIGVLDVAGTVALMAACDLLVSVDSGPLHLARMTGTPVIGLSRRLYHHPCRTCLPNHLSRYIVSGAESLAVSAKVRERGAYDIVDDPAEDEWTPGIVGSTVKEMLGGGK